MIYWPLPQHGTLYQGLQETIMEMENIILREMGFTLYWMDSWNRICSFHTRNHKICIDSYFKKGPILWFCWNRILFFAFPSMDQKSFHTKLQILQYIQHIAYPSLVLNKGRSLTWSKWRDGTEGRSFTWHKWRNATQGRSFTWHRWRDGTEGRSFTWHTYLRKEFHLVQMMGCY